MSSKIKFFTFLLIIAAFLLFADFFKNDNWIGFYYPDESNLLNYIKSPTFTSLEECRDWVDEQVIRHNPSGWGYDYECGKNCKFKEGLTVMVCEETLE